MNSKENDEIELRYWLANEDWYQSQYVRQWLARTPPHEAAEVLARIASDAEAEPTDFFSVAATVVATSGFATSTGIAGGGPDARRAGTRAALMLADLNDARCIPPLVRVFYTGGVLRNKYSDLIEAALLRFLTEAEKQGNADLSPIAPDLRLLADRVWHFEARRDLGPARADLLAVTLRLLQQFGGEANRALMTSITAPPAPAKHPNRRALQQSLTP